LLVFEVIAVHPEPAQPARSASHGSHTPPRHDPPVPQASHAVFIAHSVIAS
jgi:hypothetical protein